jgi:lantibiotic biosynthesis protein
VRRGPPSDRPSWLSRPQGRAPDTSGPNLSLCHGLGGIAELLLVSAATIGEPSHRGAAVAMLEQAAEVHGRPGATWPCGVVGGGESPGLMLGLAGIGSVLLHASAPGSPPVGLPVRAGPE